MSGEIIVNSPDTNENSFECVKSKSQKCNSQMCCLSKLICYVTSRNQSKFL